MYVFICMFVYLDVPSSFLPFPSAFWLHILFVAELPVLPDSVALFHHAVLQQFLIDSVLLPFVSEFQLLRVSAFEPQALVASVLQVPFVSVIQGLTDSH